MAGIGLDLALLLRTVVDEANLNFSTVRQASIDLYENHYPGFFAPFKSGRDVGLSLVAPIGAPIALGLISSLFGVASAISSVICATSLITAGACAAFQATDARDDSLSLFVVSGLFTVALPLLAVLTSILAVAALIVPLVSLVTRTGATIVNGIGSAISACCNNEDDELEERNATELDNVISTLSA